MSQSNPHKLIILDRDGVINYDSKNYIKSPEEWIPVPGSLEAISRLKQAGYSVAIATNQSGLARGYYDLERLNAMHNKMQKLLADFDVNAKVDYIRYCPHGPDDNCHCRKPKPGMLLKIAEYFSIKPEEATFVGDKNSDKKAAKAANMQFVLLKTAYKEDTPENNKSVSGDYDSLKAWVDDYLR